MTQISSTNEVELVPSVYFAESTVHCAMEYAWRVLLDYEAWNPTFVGANVTTVEGTRSTEGELVLISNNYSYPERADFPPYHVRTLKIIPGRRIVWYCYAKEGLRFHNQSDPFRNFVDFGITPEGAGVRFNCYYYQQARLTEEAVAKERQFMPNVLTTMANAFRDYCEQHCHDSPKTATQSANVQRNRQST